MELVADANIVMSALISFSGKTAEMIFSDKLKLYAPEFLLEEVNKYKGEISEKSGLSFDELNVLLVLISLNIEFVPFSEFGEFEKQASEICPDPNDVEYFALALKLGCFLWSNDRKLKQDLIKVLNTSELLSIV